MERFKPVTANIEGYLLALIERPEVLAGKLYGLKTYKMAVREIGFYLMNTFVQFCDYELQQMQHSVMPCDCPFLVSLFVSN